MEQLFGAFKRNADGSWTCIRSVTLNGPGGRMQVAEGAVFRRGSVFMGVDLAKFLDAQGLADPGEQLNH